MSSGPYGQDALEFIEKLDRLRNADASMDAARRFLINFGVELFCFNEFPGPQQTFDEVILTSRLPAEFLKMYLDGQYVHVDPTMRLCKRTVHPFATVDAPYDPDREPRAAELVRRSTEFGMWHGFWVPIPSPTGCEGGVWFGGQKFLLTKRDKPMLHLIAFYVFYHIQALTGIRAQTKCGLTSREREVLCWIAQGKTAWEISEILDLSQRTVEEHTQSASRKLGAANRTQAVAIALRKRLFEI